METVTLSRKELHRPGLPKAVCVRAGLPAGPRYGDLAAVCAKLPGTARCWPRRNAWPNVAGFRAACAGRLDEGRALLRVASEEVTLESSKTPYASTLGMRPLRHPLPSLAKLYRRMGREAESQERFTTATTMYREMRMTYWLERAQREFES